MILARLLRGYYRFWIPAFAGITLFLVVLLCCSLAHAKSDEKLKQVEAQISQQKQQQAALDKKAQEAGEGLKELRDKLISATDALQTKEEEQERLEDRLDDLAQQVDVKNKQLKDERAKLGALTGVLIELSRQPPESLFLQSSLTTNHIHRAILVRAVLPRIKEEADTVTRDLAALNDLQRDLAEQKHLVIAAQKNMEGQQHDLDQLIKSRQGLLQRTEEQKAAITAQLVALSGEAKNLHQLLDKVSPQRGPKMNPQGLQSALKPPVAGSLLHGFGAKDADGVTSEGLTYTALPGAPVVAPQAGRVVFAGPFRGYGQIVILQHASGYHSFLAGFGRIDADIGQEVASGEPLGVLPVKGGGSAARPELYFEWRHNHEAIDPAGGIALSKN